MKADETSKAQTSTLTDAVVQKQMSILEFYVMLFHLKHAIADFMASVGSCVL